MTALLSGIMQIYGWDFLTAFPHNVTTLSWLLKCLICHVTSQNDVIEVSWTTFSSLVVIGIVVEDLFYFLT